MVEDTSTAVLEPSTEIESAPETEPVDDISTVEELGDSEQETETLTREQAEQLAVERAEAAIAERETEWKSERERETYKREQQTAEVELNSAVFGKVDGLIGWVAKQIEDGRSVAEVRQARNPLVVQNIIEPLVAAVFSNQWQAQRSNFDAYVKSIAPDWKPSVELSKKLEQAVVSRDANQLQAAHWEYLADAVRSVEIPKGMEAALKAEKEKSKPAKAVAKEQRDDELRDRPRPSAGGGATAPGARNFKTQQEVDGALYRNEISTSIARQWLAKGLPYS